MRHTGAAFVLENERKGQCLVISGQWAEFFVGIGNASCGREVPFLRTNGERAVNSGRWLVGRTVYRDRKCVMRARLSFLRTRGKGSEQNLLSELKMRAAPIPANPSDH